ncbi:MAG: ABC-2 transporter permease [Ruminococcus sp.]|nr:ABC-2 transporter permease [Ruminococcus sp.]MCM1381591.1 ABC-2 transporter permease [Muribaculaceae bacterium]MCM1478649.1 ABC-2 transporter permease [Muribaculaceae bacterium]
MAGMLYREWVLNRKNLVWVFAIEILVSSIIFLPIIFLDDATVFIDGSDGNIAETATSEFLPVLTTLLSAVVYVILFLITGGTANFFEEDESKKWAYFITSTPETQAGQIKEKYIFTLLMYVALYVWCTVLADICAVFGGSAFIMLAFVMFCVMLIAHAIEFPFMVRFGSKAGAQLKTTLLIAVTVAAFEYIFFGDLSIFGSPQAIADFIVRLSDSGAMSDIALVLMAILPYFAVGAYYLSYKISCKLYLKGSEEFER